MRRAWMDQRLGRILTHLPKTDDLTLITLKGHLLIEEVLDDLIFLKCKEPEVLRNVDLSFFVKARMARALVGSSLADGSVLPEHVWDMIDALNSLRNELAHTLESSKVESKANRFIELAHRNVKNEPSRESIAANLKMSIHMLHAYITAFEATAKTTNGSNEE